MVVIIYDMPKKYLTNLSRLYRACIRMAIIPAKRFEFGIMTYLYSEVCILRTIPLQWMISFMGFRHVSSECNPTHNWEWASHRHAVNDEYCVTPWGYPRWERLRRFIRTAAYSRLESWNVSFRLHVQGSNEILTFAVDLVLSPDDMMESTLAGVPSISQTQGAA